jgi:hypothetical protein
MVAEAIPDQSYEIRIWLPPSYVESPDRTYPALYVLDGDYCFGMAVDIVRYLIRGEYIPELIVAAVGYGSDRPPEEGGRNMRSFDLAPIEIGLSAKPRGAIFRLFLRDQLIPFVESNYRVESELRTLYGFSLGGLFGLYDMMQSPRMFGRYVIVSPPLNPSTAEILALAERFVTFEVSRPASVYLCGGELDPILPWFPRLTAILEKASLHGFHFEWEVFPRGVHMTAPAEALAKGLRATLGKKSIYEAMFKAYQEGGIDSAKSVYHDTKARAAPDDSFSESELNAFGYMLLFGDHVGDAIEVLLLNVDAHPQAWNTYDSLGEAYLALGNVALAKENYEKSVELNPKNEFGIAQLNRLNRAPAS